MRLKNQKGYFNSIYKQQPYFTTDDDLDYDLLTQLSIGSILSPPLISVVIMEKKLQP